ncbi:unnamed protein product [Acanthosepion pharaonis]|uniref:Uncharacterized protein n=1 Tax=Acanthosepion pharaonis TaxID=158019 RepID=A0A812DV01_ACAPH|nr:unnamed protein product [Sepia pharaonis]
MFLIFLFTFSFIRLFVFVKFHSFFHCLFHTCHFSSFFVLFQRSLHYFFISVFLSFFLFRSFSFTDHISSLTFTLLFLRSSSFLLLFPLISFFHLIFFYTFIFFSFLRNKLTLETPRRPRRGCSTTFLTTGRRTCGRLPHLTATPFTISSGVVIVANNRCEMSESSRSLFSFSLGRIPLTKSSILYRFCLPFFFIDTISSFLFCDFIYLWHPFIVSLLFFLKIFFFSLIFLLFLHCSVFLAFLFRFTVFINYICLSVSCQCIHPNNHPNIHSNIYLYIHLYTHPNNHPYIHPNIHLYIYPYTTRIPSSLVYQPYIYPYIHPYITRIFTCIPPVYLPVYHPYIYPYIHLYLQMHIFICLLFSFLFDFYAFCFLAILLHFNVLVFFVFFIFLLFSLLFVLFLSRSFGHFSASSFFFSRRNISILGKCV